MRVVPVVDAEGSFASFREAFPDVDAGLEASVRETAPDSFDGEAWTLPFRCFLIETADERVLVDTGVGPRGGTFLPDAQERLPQSLDPASIDCVVFTHLHVDHVGWNVRGEQPFFANARYVVTSVDWEYFRDQGRSQGQLAPLEEAGVVELVDLDAEIADGIRLLPSHGHTPGHVSVAVGDDLVLLGDVVVHPVQVVDPHARYVSDEDYECAAATRIQLLTRLAAAGTTVASPHLPGAAFGRFDAAGAGFRWTPLADEPASFQ